MQILDNGLQVSSGDFEYMWLQVRDELGLNHYRAIALRELTTLSIDDTEIEDYNIFGRQWSLIRGMYNAQVDFVYTAAGIFTPQHVGVVQFYGAAANGATKTEAVTQAMTRLGAVEGALSNYQQSRTRSPKLNWMEWYLEFVTQRAQNITSLLGHPDPRDARRGFNLDGMPLNNDLAAEQNEILFRGLAKLREDFVFQVTADRLHREHLTQATFRLAQMASNVASRRRGAISIGASLSIPLAAALSNSVGGNQSISESAAHSVQEGASHGWGEGHTDSYAHTESESQTTGGSETHGLAVTHSAGVSLTESEAQALSQSETHGHSIAHSESDSVARTNGQGSSWGSGSGGSWSQTETQNWGQSQGQQQAQSQSQGQSQGTNQSQGSSQSQGESSNHQVSSSSGNSHTDSEGWNNGMTAGVNGSVGIPGVVGGGANVSGTVGKSGNESDTVSASLGVSDSEGSSSNTGSSQSQGSNQSQSQSQSQSQGQSQSKSTGGGKTNSSGGNWSSSRGGSSFSSTSKTHTAGRTETESASQTQGVTNTKGTARSTQSADAITESHSWSKSWAHTQGRADTWGWAKSKQESWGQSHAEGLTNAVALGRGGTLGLTRGFSTGLIPGINLNRSWQTEDHVADRLTKVLTQLHEMFDEAAHGGGFLAEAVLFTASEKGAVAAESLAPQAFHGPNTPTPVMTISPVGPEQELIFKHALAFTPSQVPSPGDFMDGLLGGRFSTVLTTQQLAAYTAPAIFREGTVRVIPAIPKKGLGFYPDMPGEVMLGHQFSPETGDLTNTPVKLAKERFMHTMYAGATGFGKSVGAERFAYETVLHWQMRVVVLDFGAGWRKLLNAPGIEDKVDIRQLTPHGVRPLRWNPLQISRYIIPEVQLASFVDIFGNVAQLGIKQQKHRFYDAVEALYLQHGVLVNDPKIRQDTHWGQVQADEAHIALPGTHLDRLGMDKCQAIAVHRSKTCSLQDLFNLIEKRRDALASRDQIGRGILDGILERMQTLLRGATAQQFAAGQDALDVADLGDEAGKRLLVLEGGKFLDQFSKAWLLSWAGWLIYQDMVQQRERQLISQDAELVMIFEEANIIFTGMSAADENNSGAITVAEQYDNMFRDSRKYGVRFVVITQSPSLIPAGVRSSCSSVFLGFLADPKDKDIALAAIAKSEKGFVDEPWRRFLSDEGIGMLLGRLPYTMDRAQMRPFLMQPLILNTPEPTDAAIAVQLGRIHL